eukprot:g2258.t1
MQSAATNAREFPPGWALVVVDMQNDFVREEGKLTLARKEVDKEGKLTPAAKKNLEAMNGCIGEIRKLVKLQGWDLVVFTRDKHPAAELCTKHGDGTKVQHAAHISFRNSSYHDDGDGADKALSLRTNDGIQEYKFTGTKPLAECTYTLPDGDSKRSITQTLYPEHCLMSTWGSDLITELHDVAPPFWEAACTEPLQAKKYLEVTARERVTQYLPPCALRNRTIYFDKGMDRVLDANSAIFKNDNETEVTNPRPDALLPIDVTLTRILQASGIRNVMVAGVAADICVRQTCLGLKRKGFQVYVVDSTTRPFADGFRFQASEVDEEYRDVAQLQYTPQ